MVDTILFNGRITTLDPARPAATAVAVQDGLFAAVGDDQEIMSRRGPKSRLITFEQQLQPGVGRLDRVAQPGVCLRSGLLKSGPGYCSRRRTRFDLFRRPGAVGVVA